MVQGPSREANSSLASREFHRMLGEKEASSPHSKQPVTCPPNEISVQSTLSSYFLKIDKADNLRTILGRCHVIWEP